MNRLQKIFLVLVISTSFFSSAMNLLLRPYDTLIIPEIDLERGHELSFWIERGLRPAQGYNDKGSNVNSLQIYSPDQDALAMLEGFAPGSPMSQLRNALNAIDDGTRGHLILDGRLDLDYGGAIGGRWFYSPHAWVTMYLPFYKVRLHDIAITDLTQSVTAADLRVKQMLTNNLSAIVAQFGNGLTLNPWSERGLGDLNIMTEWLLRYPQIRPILKNVDLLGRVGFNLPTGRKMNPDQLFSIPFGWDGAVGLLYGGGLTVTLGCNFKAGFDVQLMSLFGHTRERRIKTALDQTELLLLAKTPAYKDYGLTQRFNLFVQAYHILDGMSLLVGYQFLKHDRDHLALNTCQYSSTIANTSLALDEWLAHTAEINLHFDGAASYWCDSCYAPQASLFVRAPFGGKHAALFTTIGLLFALDF